MIAASVRMLEWHACCDRIVMLYSTKLQKRKKNVSLELLLLILQDICIQVGMIIVILILMLILIIMMICHTNIFQILSNVKENLT